MCIYIILYVLYIKIYICILYIYLLFRFFCILFCDIYVYISQISFSWIVKIWSEIDSVIYISLEVKNSVFLHFSLTLMFDQYAQTANLEKVPGRAHCGRRDSLSSHKKTSVCMLTLPLGNRITLSKVCKLFCLSIILSVS